DCNLSLPQIVHRHVNATCPSAWALFNPVDNVGPLTQHHRQAIKQINTSNIVSSGATAVYHAGDFVLLRDGFHATAGSRFRAYIEGCSDIFVGKSAEEKEEHQVIANGNEISIAPNPGTNLVQVTSENSLITDIHVYNLQGRLIFAQKASASFVDLNVSSLASGIYVVTIQTEDGKVFNKKLMKN
ncbi:MAG TPA: T9SS type A sorting domain-containing protein, partial [Flavobacterium sp.]